MGGRREASPDGARGASRETRGQARDRGRRFWRERGRAVEVAEEGDMGGKPLSKEDWKMGCSEANPPRGCSKGCLLLVLLCVALDALATWMAWQMAQGMAWLVSLMAYA